MVDQAIQTKSDSCCTQVKTDARRVWTPPVDVLETKDEILIVADVPGVTANGVNVQIENGVLSIEASVEKRHDSEPTYLLREHGATTFSRTFNIGDGVNTEAISAEIRDGKLTLHLPKAEAAKPRRVEVQSA